MCFKYQRGISERSQHSTRTPLFNLIVIISLFVAALGIRIYHINRPPLDFSPIRQYQNAHNARYLYFESLDSVPDTKKAIAKLNMQRMGFTLEPKITEQIAVLGYRLTGGEHLWIPRTLSIIFWLVGGIFLYLTATRIFSFGAVLFSLIFYLFLPFSILASRSFQPDPLMVMFFLISVYAILLYHERPSRPGLTAAAVVSALAMFVKPYCVFMLFGAFVSLSIKRLGLKKSFFSADFFLFSFISLLPALIYYGYSSLTLPDAQDHFQSTFFPYLLLRSFFWQEWVIMIGRVVGYIAFTGALFGLIILRGTQRILMTGLWTGYLFFGLIFNYHIHTHEYYHLLFIPVVALSLGPVAVRITTFFSGKRIIILVALFMAFISSIWFAQRHIEMRDYKNEIKTLGAFFGFNTNFYKFISNDFKNEVKTAEEIGEMVGHSTKNIFLTSDYGRSLAFHGELSGLPWPRSISLKGREKMGIPLPENEELFNSSYFTIRTHGKYIRYTPDFFIVTDFNEFEMQKDLKDFLGSHFPILAGSEDYLVFDLRKMSP